MSAGEEYQSGRQNGIVVGELRGIVREMASKFDSSSNLILSEVKSLRKEVGSFREKMFDEQSALRERIKGVETKQKSISFLVSLIVSSIVSFSFSFLKSMFK